MDSNLFYCHSAKLMYYLRAMDVRFKFKGFNDRTNQVYWTFERGEQLDVALDKYKDFKAL